MRRRTFREGSRTDLARAFAAPAASPDRHQLSGLSLSDSRLVAVIVDRVTFYAHILETGTHSYRLAASKTNRRPSSPGHSAL
jgi:hypothetical protein